MMTGPAQLLLTTDTHGIPSLRVHINETLCRIVYPRSRQIRILPYDKVVALAVPKYEMNDFYPIFVLFDHKKRPKKRLSGQNYTRKFTQFHTVKASRQILCYGRQCSVKQYVWSRFKSLSRFCCEK